MRTSSFFGTFSILLLFLFTLPKSGLSQNASFPNDIMELKKLEYDWLIAEFKLDTATISRMMDETYISIGLNSISNKQEELNGMYASISQRLKNNHVIDSLYLDDMHIQFHDNIAIVTFISVTKGRINGAPFDNHRTRMYDVWIKRNGQWKAISSQVSQIR